MLRILLLDDDADVRSSMGEALVRAGYVVDEASKATEAAELLATRAYELAILDYELGTLMTGLDVAQACRRSSPPIPVIMSTGHSLAHMRRDWADPLSGIHFVLFKPTSLEELLDRVRRIERSREDTNPGMRVLA